MNLYFAGHCNNKKEIEAILKKRLLTYFLIQEKTTKVENHFTKKAEREDMDLYLAGGENKSWLKGMDEALNKKSLYSYFYLNNDNKDPSKFVQKAAATQKKIFLDSGGFSAFTKGAKIDIDNYIKFIKENENVLTVYAVLDVIGDFKGTMRNQHYMEKKGVNPLPVFHFGGDLNNLKSLVKDYDYIALGGLVPYARDKKKLKAWLDKCFSIIKCDCKIHGFGMTGIEILKRYPFYSVDSTSWLGGSMRAEIYEFVPEEGKLKTIKTKCQDRASYKTIDFNDDGDKRWFNRIVKNAIEWQKFAEYITNLWEKRGVKWD